MLLVEYSGASSSAALTILLGTFLYINNGQTHLFYGENFLIASQFATEREILQVMTSHQINLTLTQSALSRGLAKTLYI